VPKSYQDIHLIPSKGASSTLAEQPSLAYLCQLSLVINKPWACEGQLGRASAHLFEPARMTPAMTPIVAK